MVSSCAVSILTLLIPHPQNLLNPLDTLNSNYEDEKIFSPFYPEPYKEKFCFLPVLLVSSGIMTLYITAMNELHYL